MRIGIDFGTSYSAAAAFSDGALRVIEFDGETQFRTAVFFRRDNTPARAFALTPDLTRQVNSIFRAKKAEQKRVIDDAKRLQSDIPKIPGVPRESASAQTLTLPIRSDDELREAALRVVERQWVEQQIAIVEAQPAADFEAIFGETAIDEFVSGAPGVLLASPKSMLGFKLVTRARKAIQDVLISIFRHIRESASTQLGVNVTRAVVGRPVQFKSSMGTQGTLQALEIIRAAACAAGFDDVSFLEEPSAAAFHFHSQLHSKTEALIVDVGGGTSDIARAAIGGLARAPVIKNAWGHPLGGGDVDMRFALDVFMPLFGKGVVSLPVHHFVDAVSVNDSPSQRDFCKASFDGLGYPYGERLTALQARGATMRVARASERLKIHLSTHDSGSVKLGYIEPGLTAKATSGQVVASAERLLSKLRALIESALDGEETPPEVALVTGGMSRAPYVVDAVRAALPRTNVEVSDPSLGVVYGLARYASLQ